jgi:hypothetical protein
MGGGGGQRERGNAGGEKGAKQFHEGRSVVVE